MTELPELLAPATTTRPERASILLTDTPANLVSWRAILEAPDYDFVEARSGEEALERLKAQEFAVVLLDVRMPGLSGFDTAKLIRADERSRHTPIIFLTIDDIDPAEVEAGYALGALDFFVKPLAPVVVQAKVWGLARLYQEKQRAKHEADQLRLLVQGTIDYAIFMLDPHGQVVTWNAGAERIKQYKVDEIIGQHFSKFYPQNVIDRGWPDHELKVATAEGRFEDEGWRLRKDGSRFWANVVITALRDETGQLRGFSKVTRDLTERKQAEESLHRSEERFRHMVEGVYDYAIFMLDPHGYVVSWNPGAERFKGYKAGEIIGQHFSTFYPQEALDRGWPSHELRVATAEGRFEDEGWRVRKNGSQFWANVVITALKDERGNLLGFSKITRDLTARKQAEEDARRLAEETAARRVAEENARLIQEQRERLHVTLASIGDAVISTDAEGRIDFLNPVAEELVGWTTEDAARRNLGDVFRIVNETTRQPVENPALRALKEGLIVGLANHTVLIARDGTERRIDDSAAPIRNADGGVIGSVLVFRDVGEQRKVEQHRNARLAVTHALNQAETVEDGAGGVLRAVCESLAWDVGIFWLVNEAGDHLTCRQSWRRPDMPVGEFETVSCGFTFEKGQGLPGRVWEAGKPQWILDIVRDANFPRLEAAVNYGLHSAFACPINVGDHTLGVIEFFTRRIREADADLLEMMGTVAGNIGQFIERKAAEHELRESESRLRSVLDHTPAIVYVVDAEGRFLFINRRWQEVFGLTNDQVAGRPLHDFFPTEIADQFVRNNRQVLEAEAPSEFEETILQDGRRRTFISVKVPFSYGAGSAPAICGISADITERKRAEETLRDADRRKDEFLATLAHELRNPLAPIRNALQILKMPRVDAETVERSRDMMERQVHHLVRLVDDLLDVSRVMRGKIELRREPVELASVVARAVETVQPLVDAQGHDLSVLFPTESLPIDGDPMRLAQVVGNLLTNAAKYTEPNGHIRLTAKRDGDMAVLRVRDTGIGIALDMLPRIFELFVQVDHATTKAQGGLGIGLTLVKNLVEMHNGTVEARSDGLGKGSEFVVRLPISKKATRDAGDPEPEPTTHAVMPSGHRLLVVDDNHDAAVSLAMLLRLQGHEVRVAHSGPAVLAMTKTFPPDLIFLDIGMPDMDGYEVARRLRQQPGLENVVLAALTGWGQKEDRLRTAEAGFNHHLVKPPEPKAVENVLAELKRRKEQ